MLIALPEAEKGHGGREEYIFISEPVFRFSYSGVPGHGLCQRLHKALLAFAYMVGGVNK